MDRLKYCNDTDLYQFLDTRTSDRCLLNIVQLLGFLGFSLYPIAYSLTMTKTKDLSKFTVKTRREKF